MKEKEAYEEAARQKVADEAAVAKEAKQAKVAAFNALVQGSDDLTD